MWRRIWSRSKICWYEDFDFEFEFDEGEFEFEFEGLDDMEFHFEGEDKQVMPGFVTAIGDDTVTIDLNHPLAGQCLNFDIEVVSVRDASAEELQHRHPHGPGGHEH